MKLRFLSLFVLLLHVKFIPLHGSNQIEELDDRFIDYSKQGKWLISFYAPWCGHCKNLEPIYNELAQHFTNSNVRVAKLDATRFSNVANHFDIKGYPTIKFISDGKVYNYNGERSKLAIVEFIEKANGPKIRQISNENEYLNVKEDKKHFFMIILESKDDNSSLRNNFIQMANAHFTEAYFYECSIKKVYSKYFQNSSELPALYTIKEEKYYKFDGDANDIDSIKKFMKQEQFLTFSPVTMTNLHKLIDSKKNLLIYIENQIDKNEIISKKVKHALKSYSEAKRDLYFNDFQFGFSDNIDLFNGIAIWTLETPVLFIFNTRNFKYGLVHFKNTSQATESVIEKILNDFKNNKIELYGGDGYLNRLRKPFWELYKAILEMFIEAPFISLLVFGLPLSLISLVCYCMCCCEYPDEHSDHLLNENVSENEEEAEEGEESQQQVQVEDESKKTI